MKKKLLYIFLCIVMVCVCLSIVACESVTPKLRINADTNYWEVSYDNGSTWESLDVKATGDNGANGSNGQDGSNGANGSVVTIGENGNWFIDGVDTGKPATARLEAPQLRINADTNYWEVSYDEGTTWQSLDIKATGENGTDGTKVEIGPNGNWFIDGVDTGKLSFCVCSMSECECGCTDIDKLFIPTLRFVVASDIHMRENGALESKARLEKLYDEAYLYAKDNSVYNKLDGMFFCGDLTQDGRDAEYQLFFDTVNAKNKAGTISRAVLGNHDYRINGYNDIYAGNKSINADYIANSITAQRFKDEWAGYEADGHIVLGGYHFIFLSTDQYNTEIGYYYRIDRRNWLKAELDKAVADDPTGEKPIFVFNHMAPRGTCAGSSGTGADPNLHNILKDYPNVVDFSGHTHKAQVSPDSVWQGEYTSIACGAMAYLSLPLYDNPDVTGSVRQINNKGGWAAGSNEEATRNGDMIWICEMDYNNRLRLVCYDYIRGEEYKTFYLDSFGNPAGFDYRYDREIIPDVPEFEDNAEVIIESNNYKKVDITFPKAICDDYITNYRIDVVNSSDEIVKSEYVLSLEHLGSGRLDSFDINIAGLEENTAYTINVYAITYYKEKSAPLSVDFTTTAKPTGDNVSPDVLSVQFNTDGSAIDANTNQTLELVADTVAPSVAFDTTLGRNVVTYSRSGKYGQHGYKFYDIVEWAPVISNGFTMEINVRPTYVPTDLSPLKPFSWMENGGLGFQYSKTNSGRMSFYFYTSSDGKVSVGVDCAKNEWAHLVVTYDGSYLKLYKNGTLVETSAEITKKLYLPSADYIAIGCDASISGALQSGFPGQMTTANIYSDCLTDSQVAKIYEPFAPETTEPETTT